MHSLQMVNVLRADRKSSCRFNLVYFLTWYIGRILLVTRTKSYESIFYFIYLFIYFIYLFIYFIYLFIHLLLLLLLFDKSIFQSIFSGKS